MVKRALNAVEVNSMRNALAKRVYVPPTELSSEWNLWPINTMSSDTSPTLLAHESCRVPRAIYLDFKCCDSCVDGRPVAYMTPQISNTRPSSCMGKNSPLGQSQLEHAATKY